MMYELSETAILGFVTKTEELKNICMPADTLDGAIEKLLILVKFEPIYKKAIGQDRKYNVFEFYKGKKMTFLVDAKFLLWERRVSMRKIILGWIKKRSLSLLKVNF
ncbi:hypothetical protein KHA96_17270 [Bacillus sp. FJAT-49711]|uniref:hypothetical protein n=1 Tax=Bacillus sp. FJAT-49711 TaxID=2833585 RepID=UPI001BC9AC3B|nr:hypothetical protein [Bacillus sp. FJAT-49711]MBS4220065.1 hypothetical protein [Bacillus sp. FJAT-49711]